MRSRKFKDSTHTQFWYSLSYDGDSQVALDEYFDKHPERRFVLPDAKP